MTNADKIKEICNNPDKLAEFLYERDCNCWECGQSPERCDRNCLEEMKDFLKQEYQGQYD